MVMGVGAATGLAVYAFSASSNINKQIIATGLAREGMEAVRNMRDTNWLIGPLTPNGCYNYATSQANQASCYQSWLNTPTFCINPNSATGGCGSASSTNYTLSINPSSANNGALWNLVPQNNTANYGMNFDATNNQGEGFYIQSGTTACGAGNNPADYCRKIIITNYSLNYGNAVSPYNVDSNLSLVKVQSQVWWVDKKCPRVPDFNSANPACRIDLETYLTNWRNY